MHKIFKYIIIFFSLTAYVHAEIVKDIQIKGAKRISEETIKIYGGVKINKDYTSNDLNDILTSLYSTNFFEDIKVNLKDNILEIFVKEYPVINQLAIVGEKNKRYKDEIRKLISLKEKRSFINSNLSNDIEIIKKLYASLGYNAIKINSKIKKINEYNLDLVLEIDKGSQTKISSINFIGDKKIKDRRLREIIVSEEDKFYKIISNNSLFSKEKINLDLRLLKNYYRSIGYYDVQINSDTATINDDGNVDLIFSIDAGNRYLIKKITTKVDQVLDKKLFSELKKSYDKYIGEYYSPFIIKDLLDDIDELINDNNLQFIEHNVEEVKNENSIEIKFNIFESEKTLVERINIKGNNVTEESVVRSELLLDEGDPFTNINLDKSIAKIKSRNIFNNVTAKVKNGSQDNLKVIDIAVEEKPTGEISAGAGVGTNGGSFAINVSENNWLGKGQKLNFELEIDQESLGGTINYTDPNYNFFGNSINYFLSSSDNDKPDQGYENTIYSSGISTSFEQFKDVFLTLGASASYDDLRTLSTASSSLKKQSGQFSEIAGNYGLKFDNRNRVFMPTKGSVFNFSQSLPFYADKRFIDNQIAFSGYKAIANENIVTATKFYLGAINGIGDDDVRLSKRKKLSTKRLRGFEKGKVGPVDSKDHVGGNYVSAINLEANLPNFLPESTRTEVGIFLDFGNVWGVDYDSTIDDSNKIRSSTGVNASWLSPLGPLTFTLSTNLSKASTDETESFNFNLGTTF